MPENKKYTIVVKHQRVEVSKVVRHAYSNETQTITYDYNNAIDILSNEKIENGELISISPWNLLIAEVSDF